MFVDAESMIVEALGIRNDKSGLELRTIVSVSVGTTELLVQSNYNTSGLLLGSWVRISDVL